MRHPPSLHISIVQLNHGATGAEMLGERVHSHLVVGKCHVSVVVHEAVVRDNLQVNGGKGKKCVIGA
jgi:porphobilinogen deaminase